MKRIILIISLLTFALQGFSQQNLDHIDEPEYIGEAVYVKNDGISLPLEKQSVQIKSKANASMYIIGIGKVKSKMVIKGATSPVVVPSNEPVTFIVKSFDNKSDPLSIVSVVKFETTKKERKFQIAEVGTFSGGSTGNEDFVAYQAKKFKDSSYKLNINSMEHGEYGILVSNPNALNNSNTIIACFSVQ
ncbi:hypothetical protein [Sphingobacterium sp.]|uniref:hypothetical protein n=1 Tax=Sphingobacterium sp. TaxID=341027 RepID=UPI0031CE4DCE